MAESKGAAGGQKSPKKTPKKLIIVDAGEQQDVLPDVPPKAVKKPITVVDASGDTPPLKADDSELAGLAEAINSSSESVTDEPIKDTIKNPKISSVRVAVVDADESNEIDPVDAKVDPSMTIGDALDAANITDDIDQDTDTEQATVEGSTLANGTDTPEPTSDKGVVDENDESIPVNVEDSTEPQQQVASKASPEPQVSGSPEITDAQTKGIAKKPLKIEDFSDDATAKKVDDIVAKEADELLAREDADVLRDIRTVKKQNKIKQLLSNWWRNPAAKWGMLAGLLLLTAGIAVLPGSRYFVLNTAGVRVSSSIVIASAESQQPLKNADVTMGEKVGKTDEKGVVSFNDLKLGAHPIKISKRGYQTVEQNKVLGWGSNPLGQIMLSVTGSKYTFAVKDFLSGTAVLGAEATSGDFNAQADKDGKIVLPVDQNAEKDLEVTIKASEYADQKFTVKLSDTADKVVKMVPSKKHVFVSKRSGRLDVYKIDADSSNEQVLLAGTGSERDDLMLLPHMSKDYVAIVSTRDNKRNKDNYLLSGLFIANVKTGEITKVIQSERIQLVDWANDRVVFVAVTEGASAANPSRSKLYSYEIGQPGPKTIASANYFNDAYVFRSAIYYAPSSYAVAASSVKLYKVNPDGSGQTTVLDREVWNVFRSEYDVLQLSVQQDWYELKTSSDTPVKMSQAPANPKTNAYRESPDKKHALWVDTRDGKGVLLSYSVESKKDDTVHTQAGLSSPIYWISNTTAVYRISDGRETADYIKSTLGGEPKKLRDVTATDLSNYYN